MKKTLVAIAALVVSLNTFGQGQVHFANRDTLATPPILEPLTRSDAGTDFSAFKAELVLVGTGGTLTSLGTTTFNAARPGIWIATDPVVPGVLNGPATFRVRAFDGADFASSLNKGQSVDFTSNVASAPASPAEFQGFQGKAFQIQIVPEPTTLALGALGLGALLLRRRK